MLQHYMEIRYEELIDQPERVLRSVCAFIELDFDERMLRYHERAADIVGDVKTAPWDNNIYLPPTKGLRNWRTQMSRGDLEMFEAIAGPMLEDLGYERVVQTTRTGMRLKAGLAATYAAGKEHAKELVGRLRR